MALRGFTALALAIAGVYLFHGQLFAVGFQAVRTVAPCTIPVRYSIQSIDPRFDLREEDVLEAVQRAEALWEGAAGRNLFEHDPSRATLRISFEYDERQKRTDLLNELNVAIDTSLESYAQLQSRYESAKAAFESARTQFDAAHRAYEARVAAYEAEVAKWNARGGAPSHIREDLEATRVALAREASELEARVRTLSDRAGEVNALAAAVNERADAVKERTYAYNASIGEREFEEAVYERGPGRERIVVYEFGSDTELLRVLAHELGHSLGLDHVEGEDAIMYELNLGSDAALSGADRAELARRCRL